MTAIAGAVPRGPARIGAAPQHAAERQWNAALDLVFERRGGRTVLVDQRHAGPLVMQKALYPGGDAHCQAVILHPPGGIAGGDRLDIAVRAGPETELLLTTPGATRWYKSDGRGAAQDVLLRADAGAVVEWMPLETIVFDRAVATSTVRVDLAGDACAAGWEIVAFGRGAAGERFTEGRFRQSIELRRDGRLLWAEYGEVSGGDPLFGSPVGYAECTTSGLLWIAGPVNPRVGERGERAVPPVRPGMLAGITALPDGIMLARCLGHSTEQLRQWLIEVWENCRPDYAGRAAIAPRLWAT